MLCKCQERYLEYLRNRDEEISKLFTSDLTKALPEVKGFEPTCQPRCEKAEKVAAFHLQAETSVVRHLQGRELDPQHYQLLCERAALILSSSAP